MTQQDTAQDPQLSVIIPFRNVEAFRSLFSQTIQQWLRVREYNLELILVRDGAGEDTSWIHKLVTRTTQAKRLRVVELEEQSGPGAARNAGLDAANGTAVYFMDADDVVDVEVVCHSAQELIENSNDVASFAFGVCSTVPASSIKKIYQPGKKSMIQMLVRHAAVWRFVFDRHFLLQSELRFPDTSYGEDLMFLLNVTQTKPRVLSVPRIGYWHVMRLNSSSSASSTTSDQCCELAEQLASFLAKNDTDAELAAVGFLWLTRIARRRAKAAQKPGLTTLFTIHPPSNCLQVLTGALILLRS